MAVVLLFNMNNEKTNLFRVMSIRLNFACRIVQPEHQGCLIRDLLNQHYDPCVRVSPFRDEMLVMDGFNHADMNFLLNELIRSNLPVRLKAVVTPTNENWTAVMLHSQLLAENAAMAKRR